MSLEFNEDKSVVVIEEYNLYDFLVAIQEQVLSGYLVTNQNEYFPQSGLGSYFRVGMLASKTETPIQPEIQVKDEAVVNETVEKVAEKPAAKQTRTGSKTASK